MRAYQCGPGNDRTVLFAEVKVWNNVLIICCSWQHFLRWCLTDLEQSVCAISSYSVLCVVNEQMVLDQLMHKSAMEHSVDVERVLNDCSVATARCAGAVPSDV